MPRNARTFRSGRQSLRFPLGAVEAVDNYTDAAGFGADGYPHNFSPALRPDRGVQLALAAELDDDGDIPGSAAAPTTLREAMAGFWARADAEAASPHVAFATPDPRPTVADQMRADDRDDQGDDPSAAPLGHSLGRGQACTHRSIARFARWARETRDYNARRHARPDAGSLAQ